ncbi:MAG: SLBB domain-containing protein, partial [Betaproteobacteria bacterium]|nr:SLBB domain-containing protein [Betaproteobacteria bacterium]
MADLTRSWVARMAAVALTCLVAGGAAVAQSPTPEQMEAFRNLPPDQQQTILQGVGGTTQGGVQRDRDLKSPETVRPRSVDSATAGGAAGTDEYGRVPREPRIAGRDTVLLDAKLREPPPGQARTTEETAHLRAMLERALRANPYKLDASGVLRISGVAPIPLAGLTEEQATERMNRDPALGDFEIKLTLLPLEKLDAEALKPFGYDLFAGVPSTFAPVTDVPVPTEYVIGPGDRIEVQLIGNSKGRYSFTVNRDGRINFPDLGPVAVAGMTFDELKARIEQRVNEQMIGTQAVVTMGDLRSIRVFVLGEAEQPGSYTVSGLSTITNALFVSGGVKTIGSLRNIQLKRNGAVVTRLDLYDLLLNGDTSNDVRLLPGDVIFIPPVGTTAGVTGEIRRPAIYELKGEATAADLLHLGGGLTAEADARLATINRIDERRDRVVLNVDLSNSQSRGTRLRAGDVLRIPAARPTLANAVQLKGHVYRPSAFQYRGGMRLTDLLPSIDDLKPNADLHYVLIRREQPGSRRVSAVSADLEQAWQSPLSDANPLLSPRDQVIVFDLEAGRDQYLEPIVEELKLQAISSEPSRLVRVSGQVRAEGEYPLEPGMTVSDLVRAGGGLDEQAFGGEAELARYEVGDGQTRRTEVLKIDLARALAGDPAADLLLGPFDTLVVKQISEWSEREVVRLEGEVRFPGEYPIARGETLRSLIARAGGLTSLGYPKGAVFTREYLKERERQQIAALADRMRQDLATLALQASQNSGAGASQASETLAVGQALLRELQTAEPVGRLVIDVDRFMAAEPGSSDDLVLRGGDRLRVPKRPQEVTVIGEVQNATSHMFDAALTREDYLRMSGGTTQKADDKRIYVVRAN